MLLMLAVGVIIYAYMPIRARALPPLNWGQLNEPSGWENLSYLFSMIHRKQYGTFWKRYSRNFYTSSRAGKRFNKYI